MNVNCQTSSLKFYDGDFRKKPHRYCGLKQLVLPRSNNSIVIIKGPAINRRYEDRNRISELKITFTAVPRNASETSELTQACKWASVPLPPPPRRGGGFLSNEFNSTSLHIGGISLQCYI